MKLPQQMAYWLFQAIRVALVLQIVVLVVDGILGKIEWFSWLSSPTASRVLLVWGLAAPVVAVSFAIIRFVQVVRAERRDLMFIADLVLGAAVPFLYLVLVILHPYIP